MDGHGAFGQLVATMAVQTLPHLAVFGPHHAFSQGIYSPNAASRPQT